MALKETIAKFFLKKALEKTGTVAKEGAKKSFEIAKSQLSQYLEQKNRAPETIEMTKNLQAERGDLYGLILQKIGLMMDQKMR